MTVIDRGAVKQYFIGKSQKLPIFLMILGIPLIFLWGLGLILIIIGLVLYTKNRNEYANEEKVDEIVKVELDQAKKRALKKLNLVKEQVSAIDPVVVFGPADQPYSETAAILAQQKNSGVLGVLLSAKRSVLENSDDPVYIEKVGSDNNLRYTLLSITTYMFGEDQLYIYYENVDITTGLVFSEGTFEYFYSDITSIETFESKSKIRRMVSKKKVQEFRIVKERMAIYNSGGRSYVASLGAREESEPSIMGDKFVAMRNLIRDKKINK